MLAGQLNQPESESPPLSSPTSAPLLQTKEESLAHAKDFAEDWYMELRGKSRTGLLKAGKTCREAASRFVAEYEVITLNERSPAHVTRLNYRGTVQDYRVHRHSKPRPRPG
jgi:hypothetical protein